MRQSLVLDCVDSVSNKELDVEQQVNTKFEFDSVMNSKLQVREG
jgi:hypothetical protein